MIQRLIYTGLILSLFFTQSTHAQNISKPHKYKRALVLAGGGFQSAVFLGIIEGALKSPNPPDVIIATCGGSLAAALANALPDDNERRRYLESDQFHKFLSQLTIDNNHLSDLLFGFWNLFKQANQKYIYETYPRIFENTLIDIPQTADVLPALDRKFNPAGIPIVIVAGELSFGPEQAGLYRNGKKIITQTFFTDAKTAELLNGFITPLATHRNTLNFATKTITNTSLFESARASISDFYGTLPMKIGDKYYITGATDLYPIEAARKLADEVVMVYKRPFSSLFQVAMQGIYRYDNNQRLRNVNAQYADYWIDITDTNSMESIEFGPKISKYLTRIDLDIPKTYDEYLKRFQVLFEFGKERALEGLSMTTKNNKCHIRQKTKENTDFRFDNC